MAETYNARETLGVGEDASKSQIKKAYIAISKENHPDRTIGMDDDVRQQMTEKFKMAAEAYQALNNGQSTFQYTKAESDKVENESEVQMTKPDDNAIVKKSDLENENKKANEEAAEQAAIDKEAKDNAKSEPTDEVSSKTDKDDSKKEDQEENKSVAEKFGSKGMSEGWAKTTMETLTEGMTMRQEFAEDLNKAIFNKLKDAFNKDNSSPKQETSNDEGQQVENTSEQESLPQIEMQSMSDSKPLMIEGPKADELDSLSSSSQSPDSSPDSSQPSLDENDTPSLDM